MYTFLTCAGGLTAPPGWHSSYVPEPWGSGVLLGTVDKPASLQCSLEHFKEIVPCCCADVVGKKRLPLPSSPFNASWDFSSEIPKTLRWGGGLNIQVQLTLIRGLGIEVFQK